MFRVAKLYISLERLEEALQAAERIPFDNPEYAESVELRADILSHLKRFDVAYRTYQEAYKLRSTDPASSFMPSSSPANASVSWPQKRRAWSQLSRYL